MDEWNIRLKKARLDKSLTLNEVSERLKGLEHVSVQSLITYESKSNFPKLNLFRSLCELCDVSADFIMFGCCNSENKLLPKANKLLCFYILLYTNKLNFKDRETLIIKDEQLKTQITLLNELISEIDISDFNSLNKLIDMINNISIS